MSNNTVEERLAVLEEIVKRLDGMLFGTLGRPSVIDELRRLREADMQKLDTLHRENVARMELIEETTREHMNLIEDTTRKHMDAIEKKQDRIMWVGIGVIAGVGFVTGSGTITLHKLLELLGFLK